MIPDTVRKLPARVVDQSSASADPREKVSLIDQLGQPEGVAEIDFAAVKLRDLAQTVEP